MQFTVMCRILLMSLGTHSTCLPTSAIVSPSDALDRVNIHTHSYIPEQHNRNVIVDSPKKVLQGFGIQEAVKQHWRLLSRFAAPALRQGRLQSRGKSKEANQVNSRRMPDCAGKWAKLMQAHHLSHHLCLQLLCGKGTLFSTLYQDFFFFFLLLFLFGVPHPTHTPPPSPLIPMG